MGFVPARMHSTRCRRPSTQDQEAGKDGQAKLIESSFPPLNFFDPAEAAPAAAHLVHDPAK